MLGLEPAQLMKQIGSWMSNIPVVLGFESILAHHKQTYILVKFSEVKLILFFRYSDIKMINLLITLIPFINF